MGRTPAQWWSGRRVQKITLTVLLTISWAMKQSGTWSTLSRSGEKCTHMEMVNSFTYMSQMWLNCFKNTSFWRWKSVMVTKLIIYCHIVTGGSNHANDRNKWAFFFNVCDLRSITVKCEGWSYITFRLKDGTALPAIHFHQGGSAAFLDSLRKSVQINE